MAAGAPVAAIDSHQLLLFLLQCGLLLGVGLILVRACGRIGLPAVVGELLAGVLLGPSVLGVLLPTAGDWLFPRDPGQFHLLDAVGQLAVLLLVGTAGMQLDVDMVRRRGATAARVSGAGLVVPLALGVGLGLLIPAQLLGARADRVVFALFVGVALCVSAIPVIAKTLSDMRLLHRNIGQLTLTAGTIDDAVGWVLLSVVSAMATTGVRAGGVIATCATLGGVVAFAFLLGRPVVGRLVRAAVASRDPARSTTTTIIVVVLLGAAATHALALEAVFGAFLFGIVLGRARPPDALWAPLRTVVTGILAPLYFATVGLRIDLTVLARPDVLAVAAVVLVVAVAGKFVGAFLGAWMSGLSRWEGVALGAGMNSRGVVEIVVAGVGLGLGILSTEMYTIVVLLAVVTSLMAPPILRTAMRRVESTAEEELRNADRDQPVLRPEDRSGPV